MEMVPGDLHLPVLNCPGLQDPVEARITPVPPGQRAARGGREGPPSCCPSEQEAGLSSFSIPFFGSFPLKPILFLAFLPFLPFSPN